VTELLAPAKLTVSLRVVGVRDDGYHLIDAEMVTLDLCDTLHFADGDGVEVELAGPAAAGGLAISSGPDNLVARALDAVGRRAHVRLVKRIPAGAGLGGGSADAAAVLRWAGCHDAAVAARLGADVPFCLRGGRARVTGIGEQLEPLPAGQAHFTLVIPPFGCSTVAVYREWDRLGGPQGPGANDLEVAALVVEPRLARWRDRLAEATGQRPNLAGSGATWFVDGAHPGPGRVVVATRPG
jgi:4-diphosphocytidyl-2-C-methyl-D-erythritol kinase